MNKRLKIFIGAIVFVIALFAFCNVSKAAVKVERNIYSNNGSMKFNFTGLTLDTTHEYEYGLTKTKAETVGTWHLITEYNETSATIDVITTATDLRKVINTVDTGYITIKDKTEDVVALEPTAVDLKTPFLMLTNYTVIPNGKQLDDGNNIEIALRNASNSDAYYQYEKITDTRIINKYKELKASDGDYLELQNLLKQTAPTSNWKKWGYWNGYVDSGYGYTQRNLSVPDTGLYYMWLYFSGNNIKNVYGYILVDNLEPDIALEGISLPKTQTLILGKTLTLTPTFNPTNATNKIVTWSSSDESVVTVSNAGVLTAKKVGSSIITVVSQDGNRKATCTVTVTESTTNKTSEEVKITANTNKETTDSNKSNTAQSATSTTNMKTETSIKTTTATKTDSTTAQGKIPQTGANMTIIFIIIAIIVISIIAYTKYNSYKDVK